MNYSIKIDLLKLKGAFMRELQGSTATKKCVIIPVDDNDIFIGKRGCYLDITAIEMTNPQYGETHLLKTDIPKAKRDAMSEEERRAQPILGGLKPIQPRQETATNETAAGNGDNAKTESDGELPF